MTPGEWPTRRPKSSGKIFSDRRLASRNPLEAKATIRSLDAASIDVTGRVVRVASEAEGADGFAVEFDGIEAEDAKCIISGTQRS